MPTDGRWDHRKLLNSRFLGAVAQLVAHLVRIEGVRGSSPLSSTNGVLSGIAGIES